MMVDHEHRLVSVAPHRRQRLIGIRLLPAVATLGNLICGFLAIFCCLWSIGADYGASFGAQRWLVNPRLVHLFPTPISAGAYLIILAMIFDALDGRLARMTRRTSEFGAQLDSIADIVSFGAAPAALFITLLLRPPYQSELEVPDASKVQFRVGFVCALVYVSCAAIRLARYNAENVKTEAAQQHFSGLPSPGAAAAVVALLALHEDLRYRGFTGWGVDWANASRWVMAGAALCVALLMVSRLDYVHVFNVYIRRRRPPTHLVWLIGIVALGWYSFEWLLVVLALAYVLSGVLMYFTHRRRAAEPATPAEAPAGAAVTQPPRRQAGA